MTYTEMSLGDAVSQITASPAPILFPDTCALVDLIEVPYRIKRSKEAENILSAARHLAACSQTSPPKLWIVILPLIYNEWREHSQKTISQTKQHWDQLDTKIEIAHAIASAVNITLPSPIIYSNQSIENALFKLSSSFLSNAIFLEEDQICTIRATKRVIQNEAPSRNKKGIQDCMIIEHCLEFCSQLRAAGFLEKCTFTTSNTQDFCRKGSKTELDAPLDTQFEEANLSLTTNWQWSKSELGV